MTTIWVCFDLETTGYRGLGSVLTPRNRIIQIAATIGDATFDEIVCPGIYVPTKSTALHGIRNETA